MRSARLELDQNNNSLLLKALSPTICVAMNGPKRSQQILNFKRWLTVVVWLVMGLTVVLSARQTQARDDSIRAVIQQAGNADNDEVRLDYLRKLRKQPGLDTSFKEDLTKLVARVTGHGRRNSPATPRALRFIH